MTKERREGGGQNDKGKEGGRGGKMTKERREGGGGGIASFPGLPTVQFFDRLQYAKMEGEGLVSFIT